MPYPSPIRFRLNHVHHLGDVMVNHRAKAQEFRFFLRSWYNTGDIDTGTQNPDLRLQQLKMNVVSGSKPLQNQRQHHKKEALHTLSFRSARPAQKRETTWYITQPIFSYPQEKERPCRVLAKRPKRRSPRVLGERENGLLCISRTSYGMFSILYSTICTSCATCGICASTCSECK